MKYSSSYDSKKMARVQGVSLPISFKQSVEVCRSIKNKKCDAAVRFLKEVAELKLPVPYRKFNRGGTGHRKGMGPGRFPVKTSSYILNLLNSVRSNANQKGLDADNLTILSAIAKKGPKVFRSGRNRGRVAKRTHVEITVSEVNESSASKSRSSQKGGVVDVVRAEKSKAVPDGSQKGGVVEVVNAEKSKAVPGSSQKGGVVDVAVKNEVKTKSKSEPEKAAAGSEDVKKEDKK